METKKRTTRKARVKKMIPILNGLYPSAAIALNYGNELECLVAVQLSAQCTDERVNIVTEKLFKKYRTLDDYADAKPAVFEQDIFACGFYRNKTKNIIGAARMLRAEFGGKIPRTMDEILRLPGVARKTANVVLSTLYGITEGIAVDTHIRRFCIRFDLSDFTDPVHIERDLMEIVPKEDWWGFPHRLVHYGREYCPARPHDCAEHPLTPLYPKANERWPRAH